MRRAWIACGISILVDLAGCGTSNGTTFAAQPLQTVTSSAGKLRLELRTNPQPPVRGINAGQYLISDEAGNPQDGLTVVVLPFMPAMGHGVSVNPTVVPQGHGVYQLNQLYLPMPGAYELRTSLSKNGGMSDEAVPTFTLP